MRNHSAHRVHTAAGWVWHDQRNRPRWIGLRPRHERARRRAAQQRDQGAALDVGQATVPRVMRAKEGTLSRLDCAVSGC